MPLPKELPWASELHEWVRHTVTAVPNTRCAISIVIRAANLWRQAKQTDLHDAMMKALDEYIVNSPPGVEVFELTAAEIAERSEHDPEMWIDGDGEPTPPGWFWWSCQPGCLPDTGVPFGPFESRAAAIQDAWTGD